ncbi:MAG: ABC transporter transmembrane domain-containing protein, partial [Oscillospiraceae bacterium]
MKINNSAASNEKAKNFKGTIKRLFSCMKPYRTGLFTVIIFTIVSSFIALLGPKILGLATNEIFDGSKRMLENTGGIDFAKMTKIIIVLIIIYVVSSSISYLQQFIMAGVAQKTMRDIRAEIDDKIQRLPLNYYDTNSFGDVLSRVTNDVDAVAINLEQGITQSVSAIITVITIFIMMLTISPTLTVIGLITLPLTMFS